MSYYSADTHIIITCKYDLRKVHYSFATLIYLSIRSNYQNILLTSMIKPWTSFRRPATRGEIEFFSSTCWEI